jgi:hypothetical protein
LERPTKGLWWYFSGPTHSLVDNICIKLTFLMVSTEFRYWHQVFQNLVYAYPIFLDSPGVC